MNDIIVSIYVPTYNHEKYIARALDSILSQKTQYSYEVLIGEDASTDGTRDILKQYEKEHPGIFTMFYRKENMYNSDITNSMDLIRRCKGKYIIGLEGDDYWIDNQKIEKQVNFLENNPDYIAVAHKCIVVDKYSDKSKYNYPSCTDLIYEYKHYISEIMPGQLTTILKRNFYKDNSYNTELLRKKLVPGDRVLNFWMLMNGKVYCTDEYMSAYRYVNDEGSSYSATYKYNFKDSDDLYLSILEYTREMNDAVAEKYAEFLYLKHLLIGIKRKQIKIFTCLKNIKKVKHLIRAIIMYIIYKYRKDILKCNIWLK